MIKTKTQNIITIMSVVIASIAVSFTITRYFVENIQAETTNRVNISVTDSTQWNAIAANKEGVGNCHKRIDRVVDEQRLVNEKILITLEKINKNVSAQNTVLKQLCRKVDGMKDAIEFLPKDEQTQNIN